MKHKIPHQQFGFTLVELMVAMMLGLFLMTGVIQLFLGSSQTYSVVASQSQVQDTGRFSLYFLSRSVRHAGYWPSLESPITYEAHKVFPVDNAVIFGTNNSVNGSDDIYVRMLGAEDETIKTCQGVVITETQVAIDRFYVEAASGTENVSSLFCSSTIYDMDMNTLTINDPVSGTPAESVRALLSGVESMHVLYGVGTRHEVTHYVNADNITDWRDVRAIKVALLSTSNDDTSSGIENGQTYTLLDESVVAGGDSRPRMVFQQTVSMRNFIPN